MNVVIARTTAAARGFRSVKHWMVENRKAHRAFGARLRKKKVDRDEKHQIIDFQRSLDSEHDKWSKFV